MKRSFIVSSLVLLAAQAVVLMSGCEGSSNQSGASEGASSEIRQPRSGYSVDALIFNGPGTAGSDADALAGIIEEHGLSYRVVGSSELNNMSVDELADYGVIIWPGGYANQMTESLTLQARRNVRAAVRERGVSYTGFCAGSWMAVGNGIPVTNDWIDLGFSLLPGKILTEYFPNGQEPTAAIVVTSFPDGSEREIVWWGGSITPEIPGGVIARYKTGDPQMTQAWAGNGFVTMAGTHPEAPQSWRDSQGLDDEDGLDEHVAWDLIEAALKQRPLPTF